MKFQDYQRMNKEHKKGLMPDFRFPEFLDSGEWEEINLGSIGKVSMCKRILKDETKPYGDIPFYKIGTFGKQADAYISKDVYERYKSKYSYPKKGDILISASGTIGRLVIFNGEAAYFQDSNIVWIGNNENLVKNSFLFYCYKRIKWATDSNTIARLYNDNLSGMKIFITSMPEQTKIATCLSSLDDLITTQTQKIEALKTHKKGLMQQLFPQEGETVPKLRFPEFSGDWVETTLGQVAKYENGKAHEQDIVELGKFIVVNSKFISTDGEVKKFTNTAFCLAEKENILIVLSDIPNGRAIAKCFFVDTDNLYTVNQRICKITPIKAVSMMLFYLLNRNSYFLAFDDGVKQTNLKKDDVLNCPILLPKDSKEQQKIADCLSSLDDLINAHVKKCELLKTHKKGLMQGLFPSSNEAA